MIAVVANPLFAIERMKILWLDVIVVDVEMPPMDRIIFLCKVMEETPTRVVICSTLTERGAETTMQALAGGAVEIVTKPKVGLKTFLQDSVQELINAVKAAAQAELSRPIRGGTAPAPGCGAGAG